MREVQRAGQYVAIVDARSPERSDSVVQVGLRQLTFRQLACTGQHTRCAQFYGLIQPGLLDAVHAFRGLKRPLMRAGDMHGDADFVAYSWRPERDYVWEGSQFDGNPIQTVPNRGTVFVVLVHLFKEPEEGPNHGLIFGSIEHWSWVNGDPLLRFAPVEWEERYDDHLWSRNL